MSLICLTVFIAFSLIGWIFRPKSDFEKAFGDKKRDFEEIVFEDEAGHHEKLNFKNERKLTKHRTGSFNIEIA
jgi:hypothetical protein